MIQRLVHKECNLVDIKASTSFFNGIVFPCLGAPGPGRFVVVFSISFVPDRDQAWWTLFRSALPEMSSLVTFCFAYSHEQEDSIEQYARVARDDLFSDKLENLIIRPKESESGEALLLEPPWSHPSLGEHLSWWKKVDTIIIESPAFVIWPPTLQRFKQLKDDITPQLADCRVSEILIICAFGEELSIDSLGVVGRKLKGTPWEDEEEGINDFYIPCDGYTMSCGGAYKLSRYRGGEWTLGCGSSPEVYTWMNDYDTRFNIRY